MCGVRRLAETEPAVGLGQLGHVLHHVAAGHVARGGERGPAGRGGGGGQGAAGGQGGGPGALRSLAADNIQPTWLPIFLYLITIDQDML